MVQSQEISLQKDGNQIVETAVEARGGFLGRPVLLVLIVSCVLAVLAVVALVVTYLGTGGFTNEVQHVDFPSSAASRFASPAMDCFMIGAAVKGDPQERGANAHP